MRLPTQTCFSILELENAQGRKKKEALADADLQPNTDLPKALKGLPDFG